MYWKDTSNKAHGPAYAGTENIQSKCTRGRVGGERGGEWKIKSTEPSWKKEVVATRDNFIQDSWSTT